MAVHETKKWDEQSADVLAVSLASIEQVNGREHPAVLLPLNALAEFYLFNKNYEKADELFARAIAISNEELPVNSEHIKLANQKLAWSKYLQGKPEEAEAYFLQASNVMLHDQDAGEERVAQAVRCLIYHYLKSDKYAEAEACLEKLLSVYKHPKQETNYQSAFVLMALAVLAAARQNADESRYYVEQVALITKDKCAIGYTVDYLSLSEIINLYFSQERKEEALEIVACSMLECEDSFWPHNPIAGEVLGALAEFMRAQRKYKQAESLYRRAIGIKEYASAAGDPDLAKLTLNLSNMYLGLRKYADAEPLAKIALKARVRHYGVHHSSVAACVETYATILRKTKRVSLANKLDVRAREIRSVCVARLDKEVAEAAVNAAVNAAAKA